MQRFLFTVSILLFLSLSIKAQKPVTYENVIVTDSTLSKESLYNRGHNWVVSIFKNPQKVIQLNDKNEGLS